MMTSWPLRIVHGEAAYHFRKGAFRGHSAPAAVRLGMPSEGRRRTDGDVPQLIFSEQENFLSSFIFGVAK
jgi:hypothetical protein